MQKSTWEFLKVKYTILPEDKPNQLIEAQNKKTNSYVLFELKTLFYKINGYFEINSKVYKQLTLKNCKYNILPEDKL